jgi:hypothetical protein
MAELMERIEQERIDCSMEQEASCEYKPAPLLGVVLTRFHGHEVMRQWLVPNADAHT